MLSAPNMTDPVASNVQIVEASGPSVASPSRRVAQSDKHGPRRTRRIRPVQPQPTPLVNTRLAAGEPIVPAKGNLSPGYLLTKRVLDIIGTLVLLAVLWPVLLLTFLVLAVTTRGKPLFTQRRLGFRGRPFTMLKFRTMCVDAPLRQAEVKNEKDGPIFKNQRDPRITKIGRFLRSTSIDEMPQLLNVLAGDMSLVGPRPPIGREVAQYEAWQRSRLGVKPGLTCLWQVSGRSEIAFEPWVRMDLWYIRNQGISTDLKLLVKTPWTVITGRGAYRSWGGGPKNCAFMLQHLTQIC